MNKNSFAKTFLILTLSVLLAACGFHLRGQMGATALPFQAIYIEGDNASVVVTELKRAIQTSGARVVEQPADAQAVLQVLGEGREKVVMSLSGAGKVREYQLRLNVSYRLWDGKEKEFIPMSDIKLNRNFAYDDTQVLAKEAEENLLYRDMQNDVVQQIVRRLSAVNPAAPAKQQ